MQSQRSFVMHVFFANGPEFMPQKEPAGDDKADSDADRKEYTVGRQPDQSDRDYQCSCDQRGAASNRDSHLGGLHSGAVSKSLGHDSSAFPQSATPTVASARPEA